MEFNDSLLRLFTRAELLGIVAVSALHHATDDMGKINQIVVLTDLIDADIYVSSQRGNPVLIHSFSEGPINRDRLLDLLARSTSQSALEVWAGDPTMH